MCQPRYAKVAPRRPIAARRDATRGAAAGRLGAGRRRDHHVGTSSIHVFATTLNFFSFVAAREM